MEWIEILGYVLALGVGMVMGTLGSGGSLIVPIMVFTFGKDEITATAYALFLVGLTATSGMASKVRKKEIDWTTAKVFIIPASLGTWLGRELIHWMPEVLVQMESFSLSRRQLVLSIYAITLLLSFASIMGYIGKNLAERSSATTERSWSYYLMVVIIGTCIGMISGLTGAGGGILLVPAIVILMGLDIKIAVGTSLTIQVFRSFIGFAKDWTEMGTHIDWGFIASLAVAMIAGILLGSWLSDYLSGPKLKKGYGVFVLLVGIFILLKELVL